MRVLGIETSCDETAASVVEGKLDKIKVLSNVVSSQIEIHKKYNGVVPEVAAREHVLNILPVVKEALEKAGIKITPPNFPLKRGGILGIDAIAVTVGPGLVTSLITGVETAKTLAYVLDIPVIAVNHIEAHIYSNFIKTTPSPSLKQGGGKIKFPCLILTVSGGHTHPSPSLKQGGGKIKFPCLILTVSGGHTQLVIMEGHGKFKTIGQTRDDAAGEAFDKCAKLLNLGYPGGPEVAKCAKGFKKITTPSPSHSANAQGRLLKRRGIELARPMINKPGFDFSFSGLKTSLLYAVQKDKNWKKKIPEYCHEFQQAVIDVLIKKTIKAADKYGAGMIMLAGGVSANKELRKQMGKAVLAKGLKFLKPDLKYTTDNAAMVATAGYFKAKRKEFTPYDKLKVDCNLDI